MAIILITAYVYDMKACNLTLDWTDIPAGVGVAILWPIGFYGVWTELIKPYWDEYKGKK